jgi:hypothetical protein
MASSIASARCSLRPQVGSRRLVARGARASGMPVIGFLSSAAPGPYEPSWPPSGERRANAPLNEQTRSREHDPRHQRGLT